MVAIEATPSCRVGWSVATGAIDQLVEMSRDAANVSTPVGAPRELHFVGHRDAQRGVGELHECPIAQLEVHLPFSRAGSPQLSGSRHGKLLLGIRRQAQAGPR